MPIQGLVFDYGGVLLDMRFDFTIELEREHGLRERILAETLYTTETWRQLEVGVGDRESWLKEAHTLLESAAGRPLPPLHREWQSQQRLIAENIELIQRLRPPYKTSVLSNADHTLMHRLCNVHKIDSLFDDIICSADVGMAKPDRRIYALAAERLGLPVHDCVFIDDSERNVEAARDAGMSAIHFRIERGHSLAEQLAELGVTVPA